MHGTCNGTWTSYTLFPDVTWDLDLPTAPARPRAPQEPGSTSESSQEVHEFQAVVLTVQPAPARCPRSAPRTPQRFAFGLARYVASLHVVLGHLNARGALTHSVWLGCTVDALEIPSDWMNVSCDHCDPMMINNDKSYSFSYRMNSDLTFTFWWVLRVPRRRRSPRFVKQKTCRCSVDSVPWSEVHGHVGIHLGALVLHA